jgi:hypothetical protein
VDRRLALASKQLSGARGKMYSVLPMAFARCESNNKPCLAHALVLPLLLSSLLFFLDYLSNRRTGSHHEI